MTDPADRHVRPLAWVWIWLGWTALGLFFGISLWLNYVAQGQDSSLGAALTVSLAEWWMWAALTPLPVLLARRVPLEWPPRPRAVLVHVSAGIVAGVAKALADRIVLMWLFGATPYVLPSNVARHTLVYWAIVGLAHAAAYYRRSREQALRAVRMEDRLKEARLEALDSQLRPHFLFNALGTIAETVHEDPEKADRMIAGLSDLLRASLGGLGHTTPLADELAIIDRYLSIQQARFDDRLRVEIDVPAELGARSVPRLLLQPLVENAIEHGVGARSGAGWIAIRARAVGAMLEIVVEDDGQGPRDRPASAAGGIGLANIRARLEALYPGHAHVELGARAGGGAVATVRIPSSAR